MATKQKTSKKKTEKQLLADAALEQRFPRISVAEWRELVGDTSNVLTISLPSRKKSGTATSSDKKKEKPHG